MLMINTCIVGEILVISALLLKNKTLAGISIPSLLWFGIGGRINFSGSWLSAMHLTHLLMVSISIYLIYLVWKILKGEKKSFWIGIRIGILLILLRNRDTFDITLIVYDEMVLLNSPRGL